MHFYCDSELGILQLQNLISQQYNEVEYTYAEQTHTIR